MTTDEDKTTMEMYAAMIPRTRILAGLKRRHLAIAGGFALLVAGLGLARHLPAFNAAAASVGPVKVAPPVAAPAPAAPSVIPAPAPAAVPPPAAPALVLAPATDQPQAAVEPAPQPEQAGVPPSGAAVDVDGCRQAIRRRDFRRVNATCEDALASDASLAQPLLSLAKAQFEKGKSAQAAVWARRIVQVNGSLAEAYLIVGAAEQEAHHPAAAKTAYQRYLDLAPRGPYADDVRSSLSSL